MPSHSALFEDQRERIHQTLPLMSVLEKVRTIKNASRINGWHWDDIVASIVIYDVAKQPNLTSPLAHRDRMNRHFQFQNRRIVV